MSVFTETRRRNCEKPSTTQPWEWHVGPWAPHSLLGLPAKWPARVNHHPAWRVCTLCSWIHLQGNTATGPLFGTWLKNSLVFWRKKRDIFNAVILKSIFFLCTVYIPQAHELDPTKHYLRLKLLIENQVQFYTPKPEEDICDLVCDSPSEHKLIPFYATAFLSLQRSRNWFK